MMRPTYLQRMAGARGPLQSLTPVSTWAAAGDAAVNPVAGVVPSTVQGVTAAARALSPLQETAATRRPAWDHIQVASPSERRPRRAPAAAEQEKLPEPSFEARPASGREGTAGEKEQGSGRTFVKVAAASMAPEEAPQAAESAPAGAKGEGQADRRPLVPLTSAAAARTGRRPGAADGRAEDERKPMQVLEPLPRSDSAAGEAAGRRPAAAGRPPIAGEPQARRSRDRGSVHVGSLEIRVVEPPPLPPAAPQTVIHVQAPAGPVAPLARGFGSTFGLRQG